MVLAKSSLLKCMYTISAFSDTVCANAVPKLPAPTIPIFLILSPD